MPAAIQVNKEAVKTLVRAVGVREAARQMGLNEKTVLHWSHTGDWLAHTRPQPAPELPASMQSRSVASVSPSDAVAKVLADRQKCTKLGLSLYTARAARVASKLPKDKLLAQASDIKAVADIAAKVWPEQQQTGSQTAVIVSVNVLGSADAYSAPVVTLESQDHTSTAPDRPEPC